MLHIRPAAPEEFAAVRAFYHTVTDQLAHSPYSPGWVKGVYPDDDMLRAALEQGELFLGDVQGETVAAMIMNSAANDGYRDIPWPTAAAPQEVTVLHALCVSAPHTRRGYAGRLVRFATEQARAKHHKALRLDVLAGNLPAERLYPSLGFRQVAALPMYYPDTGWTDYILYEYAL